MYPHISLSFAHHENYDHEFPYAAKHHDVIQKITQKELTSHYIIQNLVKQSTSH